MNFDTGPKLFSLKLNSINDLNLIIILLHCFFLFFVYQDTDPMCPINNLIDFPSVSFFENIYHIPIYILTGSILFSNRLQVLRLILSKFKRSD